MTHEKPPGEKFTEAELDAVMREVPKGAIALAGISVLLLLAGWFYVYLWIFIPRGSVG